MSEESAYFRSLGVSNESRFDAESYRRDGFGSHRAFSGLVADTGTDLIGYLFYHQGYDLDDAARVLYVIDLYVRRDSRRRGVGRTLMEKAVNVCRRLRGSQVCWSVYKRLFWRGCFTLPPNTALQLAWPQRLPIDPWYYLALNPGASSHPASGPGS